MNFSEKKYARVSFDCVDYILHANKTRVYIYSAKNLDLIDILDDFGRNVKKIITNSRTHVCAVYYDHYLAFYAPAYTNLMRIKWNKKYLHSFTELNLEDIALSGKGEYMVVCGLNLLEVYKLRYQLGRANQFDITEVSSYFKIRVKENVRQVSFSPDSRYFVTKGEMDYMLFLWSLPNIISSKTEENEDQKVSVENYGLLHSGNVVAYLFKDAYENHLKHKFQPTSILTLDSEGVLSVWQENQLKKDISFFNIASIRIENYANLPDPPLISWITLEESVLPESYFNPSEVFAAFSKLEYGVYESEQRSVDWLMLLKPNQGFDIYKVTGLRNISSFSEIKNEQSINSAETATLTGLIHAWSPTKDEINMIALDREQNIVKTGFRMSKDEMLEYIRHPLKMSYGTILRSVVNRIDGSLVLIDDNLVLKYMRIVSRILPENCYRLTLDDHYAVKIEKKFKILQADIIAYKNFVLVFDESYHGLHIIHFDKKISMYEYKFSPNEKEYFPDIDKFHGHEFLYQSLLDSTENDREFMFTLLVGHKNSFRIIKLTFLWNLLLGRKFDVPEHKIFQLQDRFFLFESILDISLDEKLKTVRPVYFIQNEDLLNLKIFGLSSESRIVQYKIDKDQGVTSKKILELKTVKMKDFGVSKYFPNLLYVLDENNTVYFYANDGEPLTHLSIKKLLENVDEGLVDRNNLRISIIPFYKRVFLIIVENFIFTLYIEFDTTRQIHVMDLIHTSLSSNEVYAMKVPRGLEASKSHAIYKVDKKTIVVVGENRVRNINGCFDETIFSKMQEENLSININFLSDNLNMKLLRTKGNMPQHHPDFIFELLILAEYDLLEIIFKKMLKQIRKKNMIGANFHVSLEKIMKLAIQKAEQAFNKPQEIQEESEVPQEDDGDIFADFMPTVAKKVSKIDYFSKAEGGEELSDQDYNELLKFINEGYNTNLKGSDNLVLASLINGLIDNKQNKRALDEFASIFLFQLKVFNITSKHVGNLARQRCLMTKDIIWALHSTQKDTLIDYCLRDEFEVTWDVLKKYGIIIWYDNLPRIKQYIEKYAQNLYRRTKDGFQVMLWYLLLNKKSMLLTLFKADMKNQATYKLLQRDFNEAKNREVARKNAYAVFSKRDFPLACALFLLAGDVQNVIDIMIEHLQDIQLAILTCKLLDESKDEVLFKKIIEKHFLLTGKSMNDIWLRSMGFTLLKQHINSVNCLYEFYHDYGHEIDFADPNKKSCETWSHKYDPMLSAFHPSAMILADKLLNSVPVKRELAEQEQPQNANQDDDDIFSDFWAADQKPKQSTQVSKEKVELKQITQLHIEKSLKYYEYMHNPVMGFVFYQNYKAVIETNYRIKYLLRQMYEDYIDFAIEEAIDSRDWQNYFEKLEKKIKQITTHFPVKEEPLHSYIEQKFSALRSLKLSVSYLASRGRFDQCIDLITQYSQEFLNIISNECYKNPFAAKKRHFIENLIFMISELTSSINLLEFYELYSNKNSKSVRQSIQSKTKSSLEKRNSNDMMMVPEDEGAELNKFRQRIATIIYLIFSGVFILSCNLFQFLNASKVTRFVSTFLRTFSENQTESKWKIYQAELDGYIADLINSLDAAESGPTTNMSAKTRELLSTVFKANFEPPQHNENSEEVERYDRVVVFSLVKYLLAYDCYKSCAAEVDMALLKKMQKTRKPELSTVRIVHCLKEYKNAAERAFFIFLNKNILIRQLRIFDDIRHQLTEDPTFQKDSCDLYLEDHLKVGPILKIVPPVVIKKLLLKVELKLNQMLFTRPLKNSDAQIEQEKTNILKSGFEIVRMKGEVIKGFCFNKTLLMKNQMAVLTNRGIKKMNVVSNILYKTRLQDGLAVLEDDATSIMENHKLQLTDDEELLSLKRDLKNRPPSIQLTYKLILNEEFDRISVQKKNSVCINRQEGETFGNFNFDQNLLMSSSEMGRSSITRGITEVIDSNVLVSHPKLPIYCTGNKGGVSVWSFQDQSLVGSTTTNRKDAVNRIKFNNFGNKLAGIDASGNFYMWNLALGGKVQRPFFSITSAKDHYEDFCFLNDGSVIALSGFNPKSQFTIIDLLLPPKVNAVKSDSIGASEILYNPLKQTLLLSNCKKGLVGVYDLRKNALMKYLEVAPGGGEVKAVTLSDSQNVIIAGGSTGVVKFFNADTFEEFKEIQFRGENKKAVSVVGLEVWDNCVYAATNDGLISMLTTLNY